MSASPTLVSITDCVQYFAKEGVIVDRTTISRCVKKHGLTESTRGRQKLVDPAKVLKFYSSDYQRKVMSGEESGLRTPVQAASSERTPVAAPSDEPAGTLAGPGTAKRTVAEDEKAEKVRALRRSNAEAEGLLMPTAEVAAAMAAAVAEQRTIWNRLLREFSEKQAAALDLDTAQAVAFKAAVKDFLAAGQNAFAVSLRELLQARDDDPVGVALDFDALIELAEQQAERRRKDSQPHAA